MFNIMAMILQKSEVENKTQARKGLGTFCFKEYRTKIDPKWKKEGVLL